MEMLKYFFGLNPGSEFNYYIPFLVYCAVLIISGYGLSFYINKQKEENRTLKVMFGNLPNKLKWLGFVSLFLLANRYESIPYFSMRIWMYISVGLALWFIGKNLYLLVKKYPAERNFYLKKQHHTENQKSKKVYTMKKKKK